jgi:hypothetical protein
MAEVTETPTDAPAQDAPVPLILERLWRYSGWVHIGPGADECEHVSEDPKAPKNECTDPEHFHAWCRLPNQFQHESLREKALAAKGRRRRQLVDPATDAHDALEGALDTLAAEGDTIKESIVVELLDKDRWTEYVEAHRDVMDLEEGEEPESEQPIRPFAQIGDDQERLAALKDKPEDEQPKDEIEELERHVARYDDLVEKRRDELHKPKYDALMALDVNALIDRLRDRRIAQEVNAQFMTVYFQHECVQCAMRWPGGPRRFASLEELFDVAPEVYEGLRSTFDDLERSQAGVASGNS